MPSPFPADCAARFTAGALLASGGQGAVYRAADTKLGGEVAVKLLLAVGADEVQRFVAEARITSRLRHPSIVRVVDAGGMDAVPWIAYELLPGPSVRTLLAQGPLPVALAVSTAAQVCGALAEAHANDVLHRDIKPENVLQAGPGEFRVADFGIAKWTGGAAVKTRTGIILGTPAYLAPERVAGEGVTAAADLYAVGALLHATAARIPAWMAAHGPEAAAAASAVRGVCDALRHAHVRPKKAAAAVDPCAPPGGAATTGLHAEAVGWKDATPITRLEKSFLAVRTDRIKADLDEVRELEDAVLRRLACLSNRQDRRDPPELARLAVDRVFLWSYAAVLHQMINLLDFNLQIRSANDEGARSYEERRVGLIGVTAIQDASRHLTELLAKPGAAAAERGELAGYLVYVRATLEHMRLEKPMEVRLEQMVAAEIARLAP